MKTITGTSQNEQFAPYSEATTIGVFLVVIPVLFSLFSYLNHVQFYGGEIFIAIMAVGAVVARLAATAWIYKMTKELNRKPVGWMILALLLPGTALVIIGQKNIIKQKGDYRPFLYKNTTANKPVQPKKITTLDQPIQWAS